ncbi:MAG: glycosyltransferase family 61 protein [Cyanobacteria bacterium]|nr:glycosyltransferase family 61 protein [Cyanobacteriota bacterium]
MTSTQPRAVELHGRQSCHYQLANPGNQALGRISEFLAPLLLDPQSYGVMPEARLVSSNLVGVGRNRRIVEETLHLKEIEPRLRRTLRLRSLLPAQERLQGAVCSLIDSRQWTGSYYHWFLDCLPRLIAVDDHSRRTGEPTRVIVPAHLNRWQSESLELLGLSQERRISHAPVGRGGLAVERLITYVAHRWQRQGGAPFDAASPWAIRTLATQLGRGVAATAVSSRRLYLSRSGVPTRQVSNEGEVMELLKRHGFVAIQTEKLTLREQIALFRDATHIVAPHGASLTNLLHVHQASVLEIFQEGHGVRPDFFQLAMIKGLDYQHCVCPTESPDLHCHVDLQILQQFLERTL